MTCCVLGHKLLFLCPVSSFKPYIGEVDLIVGLQNKDNKAFAVLYDNYAPALLGIIVKIVRDEAEAENLLQDAFVKIWRNIHQYDATKGRLFTWILNIARNTAINYLRSSHYSVGKEIQSIDNPVSIQTAYSENIDVNYIGVAETVEKLEPKLKQIIDLIYFMGYTQQEVSEKLDMPLGTVKTRTRMALLQLRKHFSNDGHSGLY